MVIKGLYKSLKDEHVTLRLRATYDIDIIHNRITVAVMGKIVGHGAIYDSDYVSIQCLNTVAMRDLNHNLMQFL